MMNLNESVAKLQSLLPKLKANDAKFAADLVASYKKYHKLTPKQEPWIEKLILRAENPAPVFSAPLAAPAGVHVGGFANVVALFSKAKEHLKYPKVRLVLNGTKVILSLNGQNSKKPGHVSVSGEGVYPNRMFYGTVSPEGVFSPFKNELPGLTALLTELGKNPTRVAKEHGKLTGNCMFCGKVLGLGEDQRSVVVGYGPVCAENWVVNGKAKWLAAAEKIEKVDYSKPSAAEQHGGEEFEETKVAPVNTHGLNDAEFDQIEVALDELIKKQQAKDLEAMAVQLDAPLPTCLFCEQPSKDAKVLNGHTVCHECLKTLTTDTSGD